MTILNLKRRALSVAVMLRGEPIFDLLVHTSASLPNDLL